MTAKSVVRITRFALLMNICVEMQLSITFIIPGSSTIRVPGRATPGRSGAAYALNNHAFSHSPWNANRI